MCYEEDKRENGIELIKFNGSGYYNLNGQSHYWDGRCFCERAFEFCLEVAAYGCRLIFCQVLLQYTNITWYIHATLVHWTRQQFRQTDWKQRAVSTAIEDAEGWRQRPLRACTASRARALALDCLMIYALCEILFVPQCNKTSRPLMKIGFRHKSYARSFPRHWIEVEEISFVRFVQFQTFINNLTSANYL